MRATVKFLFPTEANSGACAPDPSWSRGCWGDAVYVRSARAAGSVPRGGLTAAASRTLSCPSPSHLSWTCTCSSVDPRLHLLDSSLFQHQGPGLGYTHLPPARCPDACGQHKGVWASYPLGFLVYLLPTWVHSLYLATSTLPELHYQTALRKCGAVCDTHFHKISKDCVTMTATTICTPCRRKGPHLPECSRPLGTGP